MEVMIDVSRGLSPHLRGNLNVGSADIVGQRSIPAPAGEPTSPSSNDHSRTVYPRTCGGTSLPTRRTPYRSGLSPHLRGNLGAGSCHCSVTPVYPRTCGGTRVSLSIGQRARFGVYPRTCGGTRIVSPTMPYPIGLSPHLRGNRSDCSTSSEWHRSIPAPAGEPITPSREVAK